ncbi:MULTISPECIES: enoyl-CoA hydratase [Pontibacillus]|uniref:Enoyl-CoA hydratase n=1 Tax=Pontibacillus chungwhensis TaxID=265426 RepID=A0ABY8V4Y7_9BACI|nr:MULTISPECIES: enoyl-CoA hydratase [Pontibacillus]MCD5324947.1 enoyl-CoA hydratase [Pontibacillus sp. HN14]WIF98906.1 enoyl-CoA hydratase [Pontibacillus chungwhensis]
MSYYTIDRSNGITHLQLNRPDKMNALNQDSLRELKHHLQTIEDNQDLIVILSGAGKGFCAGGDLAMMQGTRDKQAYEEVMDDIEEIMMRLFLMKKLVISAVHGPAVGLGLSLALACDYVVAHKEASLSMNFIGVGLLPDGGGHFWLQERLGTQRAKLFAWDGKALSGEEALTEGLVDEVCETEVEERAENLAAYWSRRPLQAMIRSKRVYHGQSVQRLKHLMDQERLHQFELRHTEDHKEAVAAFMEKRSPVFKGE